MSEAIWPRRKFLKGGGWVFLGGVLLGGCGADSSSPTGGFSSGGASGSGAAPLPDFTRKVTGTVNTAELGGSGLNIYSVWQPAGPVQNGQYSTVVTDTPQVLFLLDSQSKVRGLVLTLPGVTTPTVDAQTTAISLIFLTIGILSTDPAEATARLAQIQGLPSFAPFLAYLRTNLSLKPLQDLLDDPTFQSLRFKVRDDMFALLGITIQPKTVESSNDTNFCDADYRPSNVLGGESTVSLGNNNFRYVSVIRRDIDRQNTEIRHAEPQLSSSQNPVPGSVGNLISGYNVFTWGNILTGQSLGPGSATDSFVPPQNLGAVDYYVFSLGVGLSHPLTLHPVPGSFTNAEIARAYTAALVGTAIFYILGPVLDVIGMHEEILKGAAKVTQLAHAASGAGVNVGGLKAAGEANDGSLGAAKQILGASVDLAIAVTGLAIATFGAPAEGTFAALAAGGVAFAAGIFAVVDYVAVIHNLATRPSVGLIEIRLAGSYTPVFIADVTPGTLGSESINDNGHVVYYGLRGLTQEFMMYNPIAVNKRKLVASGAGSCSLIPGLTLDDRFAFFEGETGVYVYIDSNGTTTVGDPPVPQGEQFQGVTEMCPDGKLLGRSSLSVSRGGHGTFYLYSVDGGWQPIWSTQGVIYRAQRNGFGKLAYSAAINTIGPAYQVYADPQSGTDDHFLTANVEDGNFALATAPTKINSRGDILFVYEDPNDNPLSPKPVLAVYSGGSIRKLTMPDGLAPNVDAFVFSDQGLAVAELIPLSGSDPSVVAGVYSWDTSTGGQPLEVKANFFADVPDPHGTNDPFNRQNGDIVPIGVNNLGQILCKLTYNNFTSAKLAVFNPPGVD